jgi:hypothetical protein
VTLTFLTQVLVKKKHSVFSCQQAGIKSETRTQTRFKSGHTARRVGHIIQRYGQVLHMDDDRIPLINEDV